MDERAGCGGRLGGGAEKVGGGFGVGSRLGGSLSRGLFPPHHRPLLFPNETGIQYAVRKVPTKRLAAAWFGPPTLRVTAGCVRRLCTLWRVRPLDLRWASSRPASYCERLAKCQATTPTITGKSWVRLSIGYSGRNILPLGRVERRAPEERKGEGLSGRRLRANPFGLGQGSLQVTLN